MDLNIIVFRILDTGYYSLFTYNKGGTFSTGIAVKKLNPLLIM